MKWLLLTRTTANFRNALKTESIVHGRISDPKGFGPRYVKDSHTSRFLCKKHKLDFIPLATLPENVEMLVFPGKE